MRHQGDGPVSRHLPELVAHAADNAQPNGPPSTLTCSRKGTWTSYPAAQARYANARNPAELDGSRASAPCLLGRPYASFCAGDASIRVVAVVS